MMEDQLEETKVELLEAEQKIKSNEVLKVTKQGRRYTNKIRELYYKLIAKKLPPSKIQETIKTVISTFAPNIDTTQLNLPKATLASTMCSHELVTISAAHKATRLAEAESCHINSDGTTLNQKKVQGFLANGVTLGVTDVTDGSATAAFEEMQVILDDIKEVATELSLPNADHIGWSMVKSAMSDRASTQTALNKLIVTSTAVHKDQQATENVTEQCGEAESAAVLEAFCGMHLGINLRVAEVNGFDRVVSGSGIDSLVHAVCKLIGHLGGPEYSKGVQCFPEFIKASIDVLDMGDVDSTSTETLKEALGIKLDRQVGSRYFVTSRNAGRIFFLHNVILDFIKNLTLTKELNGLEKEVQTSLQDNNKVALLKADALFFDKIYADLMILLKNNELGKKLLDMNQHYLELLQYLEELSVHPRLIKLES